MSDQHLHLYPHQIAGAPTKAAPPDGPYPLDRVEQYVEAAAVRGVREVALTEHLFRFVEAEPVLGRFWGQAEEPQRSLTGAAVEADRTLSLERYVDVVARAQASGLPVRLGVEVDYFPESIDAALDLLAPYPFDLLIGSIHWIGGWWFDRDHAYPEWERRGHRAVYEQYFALAADLAASGSVDVLAHLDRVKYLGHRLAEEPADLYEEVVSAAAESGVAVELSSAGLRHPVAEVYPAPGLLRRIRDAGLDITLASDAHDPATTAWRFDELQGIARRAGFTHTVRFEQRRRIREPLPSGDDSA